MPLYIVRWAGLHASLVSARNEADLLDVLDQVADPGGCSYSVYKGPVWIDFELPLEVRRKEEKKTPASVEDYEVEPTAEFRGSMTLEDLRVELPLCDHAQMMQQNVMRVAFPHLHEWAEAEDERWQLGGDDEVPEEEAKPGKAFPPALRAALLADLEPLVRYSRVKTELETRDDPEAAVMKAMDVTVIPPTWNAAAQSSSRGKSKTRRKPAS